MRDLFTNKEKKKFMRDLIGEVIKLYISDLECGSSGELIRDFKVVERPRAGWVIRTFLLLFFN